IWGIMVQVPNRTSPWKYAGRWSAISAMPASISLPCTWTIIPQMHGSEIDAADIGHLAVYYHDFAMQAAEEVGAHAHQLGLGIKYMHPDAGFDHLADVLVTQVHGAVAIDDDFHMGAIARGADQCSLQLLANLVFQNDEGLQP